MEVKLTTLNNLILPDGREWYYEHSVNSSKLIITVGDSWTWGDSLGKTTSGFDDRNHRVNHIYGSILSKRLGTDFINIGIPGGSNLYILTYLEKVLKSLTKSYDDTCIIFTLTESGRELNNGFLDQQSHYEAQTGDDWPKFNAIVNCSETIDQRDLMLKEIKGTHFEHVVGLFLAIRQSTNLFDLLSRYEKYTIESIRQRVPGVKLARNFTSIINKNEFDVKERWTDIIASRGKLPEYPNNVYVLSQIGLDPLLKISQHLDTNQFKQEWVCILDESNKGIDWLINSPYNSNRATKHPLEKAHRWWAEHLYESIIK